MRGIGVLGVVFLLAGPTASQTVYPTAPDWTSSHKAYSTGAALVDLDKDGWLDFVVADGNDMARQKMTVYYNQGDGTLPGDPDYSSTENRYNGHLAIADINGDGWLDVVVGSTWDESSSCARLYLNNAGTLSDSRDWASSELGVAFHVAFGDVNGDGRPDLAVGTGNAYGGPAWNNYVHMNVGGTLENPASWVSDDTYDYDEILFVDVDRDGWLDLVAAGINTYTWVYMNNAGTLDTTATWHTTDNSGQFSVFATYGDLNDDGWFELFVTDNTQLFDGSGYFRQYTGLVGGLFTTTPTWQYYDGYGSAVTLADVDADGDLDLATGAWWDQARLFFNEAGTLPSSPDWSSSISPVIEAIVFGDVDKDGMREATETFAPAGHLYYLSRMPIQDIDLIQVDGVPLTADQYCHDLVHGWVSVGPEPTTDLRVHYYYSVGLDMGITNWTPNQGNYLYYNRVTPVFGDLNGDGFVNLTDFTIFAMAYLSQAGDPHYNSQADLNGDGYVNATDFSIFAGLYSS